MAVPTHTPGEEAIVVPTPEFSPSPSPTLKPTMHPGKKPTSKPTAQLEQLRTL